MLKQQKKQRWMQIPEALRLTVKGNVSFQVPLRLC
jgi:hypothetical protein